MNAIYFSIICLRLNTSITSLQNVTQYEDPHPYSENRNIPWTIDYCLRSHLYLSCASAIFPDAHYHYDRGWRPLNTWKIRGRLKRDVSWVCTKNEGNSPLGPLSHSSLNSK